MKMTDIVKVFEKYIQKSNDKAVITLKKNIEHCSSFKAYKKYTYSLHFTNRKTGNGFVLVTLDSTARVTNEEEEKALIEELDNKLLFWMFDFIKEKNLKC